MKASDLIFKIAAGLFLSIIYLSTSYLISYLNIHFEWGWKDSVAWLMIGFTTYYIIFENENGSFYIDLIGGILSLGLFVFILFSSQLWAYFLINIIVCLNIIIAVVRDAL